MKRRFIDEFEPIQAEVVDMDGNEHVIEMRKMTANDWMEHDKIIRKQEDDGIFKGLEFLCERPVSFWGKFTLGMCTELYKYFRDEGIKYNKKKETKK